LGFCLPLIRANRTHTFIWFTLLWLAILIELRLLRFLRFVRGHVWQNWIFVGLLRPFCRLKMYWLLRFDRWLRWTLIISLNSGLYLCLFCGKRFEKRLSKLKLISFPIHQLLVYKWLELKSFVISTGIPQHFLVVLIPFFDGIYIFLLITLVAECDRCHLDFKLLLALFIIFIVHFNLDLSLYQLFTYATMMLLLAVIRIWIFWTSIIFNFYVQIGVFGIIKSHVDSLELLLTQVIVCLCRSWFFAYFIVGCLQ
jgi:hypothetical protein